MIEISKLRFLVVEDHDFQRWHCCNVLREMGAACVHPAADGREAAALLNDPDSPIDILVTDLDMPQMDGMALIRQVAERSIRTSLVIVTSMDRSLTSSVEAMARAYGVTLLGAMPKPVSAKKLMSVLAAYRTPSEAQSAEATSLGIEEIAEGLRGGQFEAFLQPKVQLATGEVAGAEALARWRHPKLGLLPPAAFMQAIESGALSDELTWLVAIQAAGNCRAWREMGRDMNVSINVSVTSLQDMSLADRLIGIASAAGLHPRHVTLEITESAAVRDLGRKLENLTRLRMRGFGLSIDDYGTGYSSMERLQRVPFTELKIDRRFVRNAANDPSSRALVQSSLQVAAKLGMTAVAEGVETSSDWDLLRNLGCPLAQGYFVARPMPSSEFLDWLSVRGRATA